ncbi:hypothetical protein ACLOJK_030800, partial [Asimina triloba]
SQDVTVAMPCHAMKRNRAKLPLSRPFLTRIILPTNHEMTKPPSSPSSFRPPNHFTITTIPVTKKIMPRYE